MLITDPGSGQPAEHTLQEAQEIAGEDMVYSAGTKAYYPRPNGDYDKWEVEANGKTPG